ncbi:hypothetical protein [Rhodococcus gordoniae]|uniref:hypothetical protein n=1 Tax=Rhodococcus gordoniae TaxID=223392 RepID=UPI0020CBF0C9|nr:hypothetical protein [Rhodococcus gordoniae]UTT48853.1 hypothetical protein NMQ04_01105 [Rhodococcus gordoniae]
MNNFDFGSQVSDDLPITKAVIARAREVASKGARPTEFPKIVSDALLNGLAELESRLNAIEAKNQE